MQKILYDFLGYNQEFFIFINDLTNGVDYLPYIMLALSRIFSISNFAIYYLLFCAYFLYKAKKSLISSFEFDKIYFELAKVGICYVVFGLVFATLKFSINMPRPFCSLNPENFLTIIDISRERCLSSFPSGHTAIILIIAYFIWPYINFIFRIISLILIFMIGISRLTLAMHYPADIIYSTLLTTLVIYISNKIFNFFKENILIKIKAFIKELIFV